MSLRNTRHRPKLSKAISYIKLDCHSKFMERISRMAFLNIKLGALHSMRYNLAKLPLELLLLIGRQVRRIQDLQNLRLVCKLFDDIFAPVILSHIHLGSSYPLTRPGRVSLHDLTRRNESLAFVKSLTVHSLEWLVFRPEGFHEHCRAALHYLLLAPTHPFRYLRSAKDTPPLSNELAIAQEQYYLKKLQKSLSNLESVKWYIQTDGPITSRALFLKFLVLLPSLKELDLSLKLDCTEDLDSFMNLLAQVSGLQKLTLRPRHGNGLYSTYSSYFQWFGRLIANNPNLAYLHLEWREDKYGSLLGVFGHLPVDRLAQLKHLLLDTYFPSHEPAIIPHLRSLQSLYIYWKPPPFFWQALVYNGIFVPSLTVGYVDDVLCRYLLRNASLVSFTIIGSGFLSRNPPHPIGSHLFHALETTNVAQITISPPNWAMWYENPEVEASLRRCAKLRRITLNFFENGCLPVYEYIRATTKTVSRIGDKISLAIMGGDDIHRAFSECCQSEDPMMKSLQQRLVFLELQDLESYLRDRYE